MSFREEDEQDVQTLWANHPKGGHPLTAAKGDTRSRTENDSVVDAEGARALAERIASGPPEHAGAPVVPDQMRRHAASMRTAALEIVYMRPKPAPRRKLRTYVRGPDGELKRRS